VELESSSLDRLRYVGANRIDLPVPNHLRPLSVETEEGARLGELQGVLVDPAARQVRFLLVDGGGWFHHRRRLVPLAAARLDRSRGTIRVDVDAADPAACPEVGSITLRDFSDDDLVAALFRRPTAA
jgi:hypothetical protein